MWGGGKGNTREGRWRGGRGRIVEQVGWADGRKEGRNVKFKNKNHSADVVHHSEAIKGV